MEINSNWKSERVGRIDFRHPNDSFESHLNKVDPRVLEMERKVPNSEWIQKEWVAIFTLLPISVHCWQEGWRKMGLRISKSGDPHLFFIIF